MITAVLLAAGYATRLYPLTQDRPKALLPLGSGTILDAVCQSLDTVPALARRLLVTNRRFAGQFRAWQQTSQVALTVIDDGTESADTRLGAIRDLALAAASAGPDDDVLVIGTDNLFRWPLGQFVAQAQRVRPAPSIALWNAPSRDSATQFGVVIRDAKGRITAFAEKSPQPPSTEVSLCVYYFPAPMRGHIEVFLKSGGNADAPGYFVQWLAQRSAVYGIMMPGPWYDIGSLEAYQHVLTEWTQGVG